jgi:Helix-turn-helix.
VDDVADYYSFLPDMPEGLEGVESSKDYNFSRKWPEHEDKLKMVSKWDGVHDLIREKRLNHEVKANDFSEIVGYEGGVSGVEEGHKPRFDRFNVMAEELEIDIEEAWKEMTGGTRQSRFHVTENERFNVNWRGETLGLPITSDNASDVVPEMRDDAGLSQRALAERTGMSRSGVQGVEYDETTPTRWTIKKLARGLAE